MPANGPVRPVTTALLRAARAFDAALAVQWEPAPIPKPREDTSSRALGGHGDPTMDIALDGRRRAVREAVTGAEASFREIAEALETTADELLSAVERWQGE